VRHRVSISLLLAALPVIGCAPRPATLARVGTRTITVDDFNLAARANWSQYPPQPNEARHLLMEDLVRRALLLELAESRGMLRNPLTVNFRNNLEQEALTQAVNERLIPRDVPISDAEVASFYAWSGIRAHLLLLYAPERADAEAAIVGLKAGQPFSEVVRRHSPPGMIPNGGDLGEISGGALVDPLDGLVREAPVGEIVGPIDAPGEGWFVARVLSRRTVPPQAPLEVQRPLLMGMLRQRKQRLISVRAFQGLREQYLVSVAPDGPQALFRLLNRPMLPDSRQPAPIQPSPEERRIVVVTYVDASGRPLSYTLGEAYDELQAPDRPRPPATQIGAIQAWLEQQVIRRVVPLEARRRGLDRDPTIARAIEERLNNSILESVYALEVGGAPAASDAEVQAVYDRRAAQFRVIEAAQVLHVTLPDSAATAALIEHGAHAGSLRDAAKMAGATAPVIEERVKFPNPNPIWKAIGPGLQSMSKGEWAGPVRTPDGWMVLQLEDRQEHVAAFDQLTPAVQQGLRDQALSERREARLAAYTDSLRRTTHPFEIHEDVLNRVPWPPLGIQP